MFKSECFLNLLFMKETVMSKVVAPVVSSTIVLNAQVEKFASQYRLCIQKSAAAVLELANVVGDAKRDLSKELFIEFREAIGANASKDTYIKKLLRIANASARLSALSDKLPPSYTTLYALSKMSADVFTQVCEDDVISPCMTALTLSPYNDKKSTSTVLDILLSFKNVSKSDRLIAYNQIQAICSQFNIELKSKIASTLSPQIKRFSDLNAVVIEDVTPTAELETA
jgi:hypothetical protein